MEAVVSPSNGTNPTTVTRIMTQAMMCDDGPAYYDYSESFHRGQAKASTAFGPVPHRLTPAVPNGFVHRIRSLLEEQTSDRHAISANNAFTPVGVVPELPGDRSLVELPAGDVPEAIRRMRQAQAANATAHAENVTMESIVHLITDVRENNEMNHIPNDGIDSIQRENSGSKSSDVAKSKRLSVISEAASNATKSTNNSTAIEFAVRYSVAMLVPSSGSHALLPSPREIEGTPDNRFKEIRESEEAVSEEPDDTPRPSTEFNGEEASTGSIKVATEVVLERKCEPLSLLETRSTSNRPKSMAIPSSPPSHLSVRYSAPTERTTWLSPESEATSSNATPTDIAMRISIPSMLPRSSPKSTSVILADFGDEADANANNAATTHSGPPVVVTVTESTETATTIPSVSAISDDKGLRQRDSPVSPVTPGVLKKPLESIEGPLQVVREGRRSSPVKEPPDNVDITRKTDSSRTDSSNGTIKDVVAHYAEQPEMSTTDLRFSQLRHAARLSRALPDLKEEPDEHSLLTDFRISTFKFPMPGQGRRASFDSATGRMSKDSAKTGRGPTPIKTYNDPLAEIRSIPSLQFSTSNLVDKLNNALGHRFARSLETIHAEGQENVRSQTADMRERYKSFFARLDELDRPTSAALEESTETGGKELQICDDGSLQEERSVEEAKDDELDDAEHSDSHPLQRPMSPLDVVDEVNRLTVPNVNGLTQRLSDMFPSLKRFYVDEDITEHKNVELTLNEIRGLGRRRIVKADGRVVSLVKDDSFIFPERPLSTPSSTTTTRTVSATDDQSPPLVCSKFPDQGSCGTNFKSRRRSADGGKNSIHREDPVKASTIDQLPVVVRPPAPAITRGRSLTDSYGVVRCSSNLQLHHHDSCRSLLVPYPPRSSSLEARPWNFDHAYPWADHSIDITFPESTFQRDSSKAGPSKLRKSSNDSEDDNHSEDNSSGKGDSIEVNITEEETTRTTEDTFGSQRRRSSRRSLLGPVTRRIGNALSSHGKHGNPPVNITTATSSESFDYDGFPLSPGILSVREDERTVDPGDRYPTTGLSPPNTFNLDEVRSFFSDDSSIREVGARDGLGISKRFTKLRMGMTRATSAMDNRHLRPGDSFGMENAVIPNGNRIDGVRSAASARSNKSRRPKLGYQAELGISDVGHGGAVSPSLATGHDGSNVQGMGKTEFRARKVLEQIKVLWYKSGDLIRTLSGKSRKEGGGRKSGPNLGTQELQLGVEGTEMYPGT